MVDLEVPGTGYALNVSRTYNANHYLMVCLVWMVFEFEKLH